MYHWNESAESGVTGTASIMPVVSDDNMSADDSGTGWNPLSCTHCTVTSSPAEVKSFMLFRSRRFFAGFLLKTEPSRRCPS